MTLAPAREGLTGHPPTGLTSGSLRRLSPRRRACGAAATALLLMTPIPPADAAGALRVDPGVPATRTGVRWHAAPRPYHQPAARPLGAATRWRAPVGESLRVVRGFSQPRRPWGPGHRGVDLTASSTSTVRSAGDGVVVYAAPLAGRGVVSVSHGSLRTTYEPVDATVRRGDHVLAGDVLGTLGASGSHCAPASCLHWGLLRGRTYLDPLTLLDDGPSRLLPVWGVPSRARPRTTLPEASTRELSAR